MSAVLFVQLFVQVTVDALRQAVLTIPILTRCQGGFCAAKPPRAVEL
jgi:hypothetical protein